MPASSRHLTDKSAVCARLSSTLCCDLEVARSKGQVKVGIDEDKEIQERSAWRSQSNELRKHQAQVSKEAPALSRWLSEDARNVSGYEMLFASSSQHRAPQQSGQESGKTGSPGRSLNAMLHRYSQIMPSPWDKITDIL
jgi:hypothetical protein